MEVRYGIELEGPNKGLTTLVLLTGRHHSLAFVRSVLQSHARTADHVWVQLRPNEVWDWKAVREIAQEYSVTAQISEPEEMPRPVPFGVSLVWRIPTRYSGVAAACSHAARFDPLGGPFSGFETSLRFRPFKMADYQEDEVWECG